MACLGTNLIYRYLLGKDGHPSTALNPRHHADITELRAWGVKNGSNTLFEDRHKIINQIRCIILTKQGFYISKATEQLPKQGEHPEA